MNSVVKYTRKTRQGNSNHSDGNMFDSIDRMTALQPSHMDISVTTTLSYEILHICISSVFCL